MFGSLFGDLLVGVLGQSYEADSPVRLIGSVDQWSDSTDLQEAEFRAEVRRFYG